jgi:hypothetical protein
VLEALSLPSVEKPLRVREKGWTLVRVRLYGPCYYQTKTLDSAPFNNALTIFCSYSTAIGYINDTLKDYTSVLIGKGNNDIEVVIKIGVMGVRATDQNPPFFTYT